VPAAIRQCLGLLQCVGMIHDQRFWRLFNYHVPLTYLTISLCQGSAAGPGPSLPIMLSCLDSLASRHCPLTTIRCPRAPISAAPVLLDIGVVQLAVGEPSLAGEEDRIGGDVARLLSQLDSDRFEVRRAAAERLDQLVAKPELGGLLAKEFRRTLLRPDLSFEVRWHLMRWSRRLPEPPPELVGNATPEELDRLVRQLDDDSYAVRLGAADRIEWLTRNPKLLGPLMLRLKQRMADAALTDETRRQVEAAWQRVASRVAAERFHRRGTARRFRQTDRPLARRPDETFGGGQCWGGRECSGARVARSAGPATSTSRD